MSDQWIVVVARNNLHLLQQAIRSFERQIGGAKVLVVNNGSTDGTASWLYHLFNNEYLSKIMSMHFTPQHGVAHAWNQALKYLFSLDGSRRVDRVLVCNQDVMLRPETFSLLAAEQAHFVTAVGTSDKSKILMPHTPTAAPRPHPDFSCYMISRECYELVGPFDENFAGAFCEDSDYHCRMHQAGIRAYSIDLPFWHVGGGSQTLKTASLVEGEKIREQAMKNREYFALKWGFEVPSAKNGGVEYYKFFNSAPPDPQC